MPIEASRVPEGAAAAQSACGAGAVRLPHVASAVPAARRALVRSLRDSHAERDVVDDVAVVASELLGNAVRHAEPLGDGGVLLRWRVQAHAVRVEVVDGGGGGRAAVRDAQQGETSGRGLGIVAALCTGWGAGTDEAGRHTVWAVVHVAHEMPRSA